MLRLDLLGSVGPGFISEQLGYLVRDESGQVIEERKWYWQDYPRK